ncbi:MAG: hypothetical protein RL518_981 [Pseudomonadota bacterium]
MAYRFDVYGRIIVIERGPGNTWVAYYQGADGKRGKADFPIPARLSSGDLESYLEELFHEWASPERPAVLRLEE